MTTPSLDIAAARERAMRHVFGGVTSWNNRTLLEALDALEKCRAALGRLRDDVRKAIDSGAAVVDEAEGQYGYDSLRFADVRHGWLATAADLRTALAAAAISETPDPKQP